MPKHTHRHYATKDAPYCPECQRTATIVTCVVAKCRAWAASFSKWDNIHLGEEGWTFRKDGTAHCPKHMPDWARQRRLNKREGLAIDA